MVGGCVSVVKRRWLHWTTSCQGNHHLLFSLYRSIRCGDQNASLVTDHVNGDDREMVEEGGRSSDVSLLLLKEKKNRDFSAGDVLCEIQTDKAVVALEMDEEGTLAKILVPADSKDIAVGRSIAVMAESGEDWNEIRSKSSDRQDDKKERHDDKEKSASDAKTPIHSSPKTKPTSPTATEDHHNSTMYH